MSAVLAVVRRLHKVRQASTLSEARRASSNSDASKQSPSTKEKQSP